MADAAVPTVLAFDKIQTTVLYICFIPDAGAWGWRPDAFRPAATLHKDLSMLRKRLGFILLIVVVGAGAYYVLNARPASLVLTGIVTTNDVIVSPQMAGQIDQLLVDEGDIVSTTSCSP